MSVSGSHRRDTLHSDVMGSSTRAQHEYMRPTFTHQTSSTCSHIVQYPEVVLYEVDVYALGCIHVCLLLLVLPPSDTDDPCSGSIGSHLGKSNSRVGMVTRYSMMARPQCIRVDG